jgi:hypothetical protein
VNLEHSVIAFGDKNRQVLLKLFLALTLVTFVGITWSNTGDAASTVAAVPLGQTSIPDSVASLGLTSYSSVYLGDALTNNETQLIVYLTTLDPSVEAAFNALSPDSPIDFVRTANSEETLAAVQSQITSAAPQLEAEGIHLNTWGGGLNATGKIIITVDDLTSAQQSQLYQEFGTSAVTVEASTPSDTLHLLTGRVSDFSPWNAGDEIGANYPPGLMDECSTAFGIQSSFIGQEILTAGHCFPKLQNVYNEEIGASGWNPSSGAPIEGAITNQAQTNNTIDSEIMSGTPSGFVWGGPINSPISLAVQGYTTNPVGDGICTDGALEGEYGSNSSPVYCGPGTGTGFILITDNGTEDGQNGLCGSSEYATATSPYHVVDTVCHLVKAVSSDGEPIVGNGDSGGPVFRFTNSGADLYAVGEIDMGFNPVSCVNNLYPTGRGCYSTVEYTAMNSILNYWGATMVDG